VSFIQVVPDSVQAAGRQIQMISGQIEELIGQLRATATNVQGEWKGSANSAFENAMGDWNIAANRIHEAATSIGIATQTAGVNYADTESNNTKMFSV
jgi:early secretory antigenic target protein ESAT-6